MMGVFRETCRRISPALLMLLLAACSGDEADSESRKIADAAPEQSAAGGVTETATSVIEPQSEQGGVAAQTAVEQTAPVQADSPAAATASDAEATSAAAETFVVQGVVTQWRPMVLFVQPGDQIVFRQMAGHDAQTIDGMIPAGAATWQSKLGEEGFAVTVEEPGVYLYKCNPHVSLGMIGAIVVGDIPPGNLQQIEDHPQNKGMIGRAIRKLKQALEAKAAN